jgi:hypothetical protein
MAEVALSEDNLAHASEACLEAARLAEKATVYHADVMPLDQARQIVENTVNANRGVAKFETALQLADAYRAFAKTGRDRELWADILASWAATPSAVDAKGKLVQAGAEFKKLAAASVMPEQQASFLQRSYQAYEAAGDITTASSILEELQTIPGAANTVLAGTNLNRAEAMMAEENFSEARTLLNDIATAKGPLAMRANVKLAIIETKEAKRQLVSGNDTAAALKKAAYGAELLTQYVNIFPDTPDDRLAHQEALYMLGRFQLDPTLKGIVNYYEAEARFRKLAREYPTGPFTEKGTLCLGICLSQLAQGAGATTAPADAEAKFREAKGIFETLSGSTDSWTSTQADLRYIHTMLHLKQYDDMDAACNKLAKKYSGQVMELVVLNLLHSGYIQAKRPDLAKPVFERMQAAFDALPDSAYRQDMAEFTKAYWSSVFRNANR